jgi:glutamine phosphoribosylpyrophosphate amidotransferase
LWHSFRASASSLWARPRREGNGIIGMLGRTPVAARLLESLGRLEYRGYNSAGIATLEDGKLVRLRAKGMLKKPGGPL